MFEVGTVMVMAVAAVREDLCSRIMAEDNSKEKKKAQEPRSQCPKQMQRALGCAGLTFFIAAIETY